MIIPAQALIVAGVDEAGRGPLCGDVYAAAVILDPAAPIIGLADSKKLSAASRTALEILIKERALAYCIASASVAEIDSLNILQASLLAMRRAVSGLALVPEQVLVDGNQDPKFGINTLTVIKGDSIHACISAASILAKTARDLYMQEADCLYPQYGFAQHKGYGTKMHMQALQEYGACPLHRQSFAPVAAVLKNNQNNNKN